MNNRTSASKNSSSFAYLAIQYMPSLLYLLWLLFSSTLFYCKLHRYLFFPAPFLSKQPNPLFLQPRNAEYAYLFIKLIKHFNSEMREYYFLAKYALIQIDLLLTCFLIENLFSQHCNTIWVACFDLVRKLVKNRKCRESREKNLAIFPSRDRFCL